MNRDQKTAVIEEIAGQIQESEAIFAVDYRGISVPRAAELRTRLRAIDASFRVVKNSLTERAADRAGAEPLLTLLEGPTALTFVRGDAALAAKALADFARGSQLLQVKGGLLAGDALSADQIRAIGRLPAREVIHGQLVGLVASPLTGLVRGLNALIAGLASQLSQIAEQGLVGDGSADAGPADPAAQPDSSASPEAAGEGAAASGSAVPAPSPSATSEEPAGEAPPADQEPDTPKED